MDQSINNDCIMNLKLLTLFLILFIGDILAQGQAPFVVPGQEGTIPLFNQQPGSNTGGNRPIRYQDLDSIDWTKVDRRDEERKIGLFYFVLKIS